MPNPSDRRSPTDPAELAILDHLARSRWGPTGFRCPHCDHLHAWVLRTRPRVRECRRCHRQTSITSGTLLQHTRLPLTCWTSRGAQFQAAGLPTTTALAEDLEIARSTAWLLNQKMFYCAELLANVPSEGAGGMLHEMPVRRPRKTPPMHPSAPDHVRSLHADHAQRRHRSVRVTIALRLADELAGLDGVALSRAQVAQRDRPFPTRLQSYQHTALPRYLWGTLVGCRCTVSLRWLPRWLHATLAAWNLGKDDSAPPDWELTAIRSGPQPLRTLDPWRRAA